MFNPATDLQEIIRYWKHTTVSVKYSVSPCYGYIKTNKKLNVGLEIKNGANKGVTMSADKAER